MKLADQILVGFGLVSAALLVLANFIGGLSSFAAGLALVLGALLLNRSLLAPYVIAPAKEFFPKVLNIVPPEDRSGFGVRTASKWALDFLQYLTVVSLIFVAAKESGKWSMVALAFAGWFSLSAWCSWPLLRIRPSTRGRSALVGLVISLIFISVLVTLQVGVIPAAIGLALVEIVQSKGGS